MKKFLKLSLMAVVLTMTMTSCISVNLGNGDKDSTPTQVPDAGKLTSMEPFDKVEIAGAFKVTYEQGDQYTVNVEASEQAMKEMTIYVKDNELRIRRAVNKPTVKFETVRIHVSSPLIDGIEIAGSGAFTASRPIKVTALRSEIAGSGKILLVAVDGQKANMEIAGSGDIEIGQLTIQSATADIAGSGDINLGSMTCESFTVDIAGSGNVNCQNIQADKARVDIAGSGDVNLKGSVKNLTKNIAGSGKVGYTPSGTNN